MTVNRNLPNTSEMFLNGIAQRTVFLSMEQSQWGEEGGEELRINSSKVRLNESTLSAMQLNSFYSGVVYQ